MLIELSNNLTLAFRWSGWHPEREVPALWMSSDVRDINQIPPLVREVWTRFGGFMLQPVDPNQSDLLTPPMWIQTTGEVAKRPDTHSPYQAMARWSQAHQNGPWYSLALDGEWRIGLYMDAAGHVVRCDQLNEYEPGIPEQFEVSPFAESLEEAFELIAFGRRRTPPAWLPEAVSAASRKPCRFHLSARAEAMFRRSGWYPQRHIPTEFFVRQLAAKGYSLSPPAIDILESFGGLRIVIYSVEPDLGLDYFLFNPLLPDPLPLEYFHQSEPEDGPWSPLGMCFNGCESVVTASGRILVIPGGTYEVIGNTFEEAMENVIMRKGCDVP